MLGPGSLESLDSEVTFQPDGTPQVEIRFMVNIFVECMCLVLAYVQDVKPHTHCVILETVHFFHHIITLWMNYHETN